MSQWYIVDPPFHKIPPVMFAAFLIIILVFGAALFGSAIIMSGARWYKRLQLPWWAPTAWLFCFLWTLLYAWTAIAAVMAMEELPGLFIGSGVLAVLWTEIFFVKRLLLLALADAAALWFTALLLLQFLLKDSRLAAGFFVPYAIWSTFVVYLSYTAWKMNRRLDPSKQPLPGEAASF